jgi:hypothetical protein
VKTISLKKVSAVAVASLGFGLLSVVPAQATDLAMSTSSVASISLKQVTASPTVGTAVAVNWGADTTAETPGAGDKVKGSITAYLKAFPSGGSVAITPETTLNGDGATASTAIANTTKAVSGASITLISTTANTATFGTDVVATAAAGFGSFKFTPTKAGTYTIEVWNDANQDGVINATETRQSLDLTIVAATTLQPSSTIIRMNASGTALVANPEVSDANYTTTADAVPRSAAKAVTNRIASIAVIMLNADGTAAGNLHTVTADISGSGAVDCTANGTGVDATLRSDAFTTTGTNNVVVCHISADNTAGSGTVTISVTDSTTGVKTKVGTRSFTTYGSVTKLAVASKNFTIGRAGYPTGGAVNAIASDKFIGSSTNTSAGVNSSDVSTPAFIVAATDSNGNAVTTANVPSIKTSDASVITGGTCALDNGSNADYSSSTNGVGVYNCKFDTAANAASGSKATLTIRVLDPADPLGVAYLTTTIDVTVGGSISTETIAFDKTSYAPGEAMVITRTAKDSAGNPVYDGATAPAITFTKSVGGTAPAAGIYVGGKTSSTTSKGVVTVFAPAVSGAFSMNATSGNTAGSALTASSSVADANAGLLTQIDALNAKIVALNALIAKIMKKLGVK